MIKSSVFSECGKYRYLLTRTWDAERKSVMCIGLNPSTAGKINDRTGLEEDDQTITRLCESLKHLGYGELKMCNLYALISSKPSKLWQVPDALGLNDQWLETTAHSVQDIVYCWGSFKNISYRAKKVRDMFPSGKCFGKNQDGTPWHPLAMMYAGMKYEDATLTKY